MLLVLEQFNHALLIIGYLLDHDILKLLAILVENLKRFSEIIENSREGTMTISTDEFDASLAAEVVYSFLSSEIGIGHDHYVEIL